MNTRKLIKITVWSCSIALVLFIALVVHVYLVTKPVKYDNNDLQLSRIDFKQGLDSAEAVRVRSFVAHLPGVVNAMYNFKDNNLVYGYTLGKQTSENVYNQLIAFGYEGERYVVTEEMAKGGCPAGMGKNKDSFVYRCSAVLYKMLN